MFAYAENVDKVCAGIDRYADHIGDCSFKLLEELLKQGEREATTNAITLNCIMTGDLMAHIGHAQDGFTTNGVKSVPSGEFYCDSEHAAFVEFGTGVREMLSTPHPKKSEFGMGMGTYPGKGQGKNWTGWIYPVDDAKEPYFAERGIPTFRGSDGRLYARTTGMPSRPFMYLASMAVRKSINRTARRVFRR